MAIIQLWLLALAAHVVTAAVVPNAYIVQIDPALLKVAKRDATPAQAATTVNNVLGRVKQRLRVKGVRQLFTATPAAFAGFSINVDPTVNGTQISAIPGVVAVWPIETVEQASRAFQATGDKIAIQNVQPGPALSPEDSSTPSTSVTSSSAPASPTPNNNGGRKKTRPGVGSGRERAKRAPTSVPPDNMSRERAKRAPTNMPPDNMSAHKMMGVDVAHQQVTGQGVTVCTVGSGVDYTHALLGGGFGPGFHVKQGYDLVGDDYQGGGPGSNQPVPDSDPYAVCAGSEGSTAALGLIGALPDPRGLGVVGVAPGASLGAYRVFSCAATFAPTDIIMAGIVQAVKDGCKVIHTATGQPNGWTGGHPVSTMVDRFAQFGIHSYFFSGDNGDDGPFLTYVPSASRSTTSVGGIVAAEAIAWPATVSGPNAGSYTFIYQYTVPFPTSAPVYFISTNFFSQNDACSPISTELFDKVVFFQRATACDLPTQFANVKAAGARYVVVYNTPTGDTLKNLREQYNPGLAVVAAVTNSVGKRILRMYQSAGSSGLTWTSQIANLQSGYTDNTPGGTQYVYSGYGLTNDMNQVIAYSAPASALSLVPGNSLAYTGGTGVSSALAAGAAALVIAARAQDYLSPVGVRSLFATTADLLPQSKTDSSLRNAVQAGTGLIKLGPALAARTFISPDRFNLNDTANFAGSQQLRILNKGYNTITYTLSSRAANTFGLYKNGVSDVLPNPKADTISGFSVQPSFDKPTFTLGPGQSTTVTVTWPAPAEDPRFPIYSGFIVISGEGSIEYKVAYNGIAGNMFNIPIVDTTTISGSPVGYPYVTDTTGQVTTSFQSYNYGAGPTFYLRFAFGTRYWQADLIPDNYPFVPTLPSPGYTPNTCSGRCRERREIDDDDDETLSKREPGRLPFAELPTLASLFNTTYAPRDSLFNGPNFGPSKLVIPFGGRSPATGEQVPSNFPLRVLLRALVTNGDPVYQDQYESWISPPFMFQEAPPPRA